jgi:hypothetical protein
MFKVFRLFANVPIREALQVITNRLHKVDDDGMVYLAGRIYHGTNFIICMLLCIIIL